MGSLQILLLRAYLVSPFYLTPMLEITKAVKFWMPYSPLFLFSYLREFLSFKEPFFRPPKVAVNHEDGFFAPHTSISRNLPRLLLRLAEYIFSRAFSHTKNGPSSPSLVWEGSDGEFFLCILISLFFLLFFSRVTRRWTQGGFLKGASGIFKIQMYFTF